MADVVRGTLRKLLPAVAESLTPPAGAAASVLGASADDLRAFALDGLIADSISSACPSTRSESVRGPAGLLLCHGEAGVSQAPGEVTATRPKEARWARRSRCLLASGRSTLA